MPNPFNLIWSQNGSVIHGYNNGAYIDKELVFPISFPSDITSPQQITLQSSALANGTFDILTHVKFYLVGDPVDLATIQGYTPTTVDPPDGGWPIGWPNLGNTFNPPIPQINGGLQISFDGVNWTTFSSIQEGAPGSVAVGDQSLYSSWLLLPAIAIGSGGTAGQLGPFDVATFYLRWVIPPSNTTYQVFNVNLAVDCNIT